MAHAEELAIASCCFVDRRDSASARAQADEESEIIGHDRGPDVSLEVVEAAPRAAAQAECPLHTGDSGLDHQVEHQAAPAGAQVELVTVLDVALARVLGLDPRMMSACVSNRLTSFPAPAPPPRAAPAARGTWGAI